MDLVSMYKVITIFFIPPLYGFTTFAWKGNVNCWPSANCTLKFAVHMKKSTSVASKLISLFWKKF